MRQEEYKPENQNADHGIAGGETLQRDVGDDQQADQKRIDARAAESSDAELQQNASQQARGDARRDQADDLLEIAGKPKRDESRSRDHVGTDRLRIGRRRKRGDQKRRCRR